MDTNKKLKSGFTTGSSVSAGVKIALENLFTSREKGETYLETLGASSISIKAKSMKKIIRKGSNKGEISIRVAIEKDAGDDPDITNKILICTRVSIQKKVLGKNWSLKDEEQGYLFDNILITGGRGVGLVTKSGLQAPVGKYAINPGPLTQIKKVVNDFFSEECDYFIKVKVFIPKGIEKSRFTLNRKLGVIGGISILGTTGIVKPMSEEALKNSLYTELKVIKESTGKDWVIFSFGNYGERFCNSIGIKSDMIVIISNFIGFMLDSAVELNFRKVILVGHIGKAVKIAGGIFHTHSRVADGRFEIMAANAFLFKESSNVLEKILNCNTVDEACNHIENRDFFSFLADKVCAKSKEYSRDQLECSSLLFSLNGEVLGSSNNFYNDIDSILKEDTY